MRPRFCLRRGRRRSRRGDRTTATPTLPASCQVVRARAAAARSRPARDRRVLTRQGRTRRDPTRRGRTRPARARAPALVPFHTRAALTLLEAEATVAARAEAEVQAPLDDAEEADRVLLRTLHVHPDQDPGRDPIRALFRRGDALSHHLSRALARVHDRSRLTRRGRALRNRAPARWMPDATVAVVRRRGQLTLVQNRMSADRARPLRVLMVVAIECLRSHNSRPCCLEDMRAQARAAPAWSYLHNLETMAIHSFTAAQLSHASIATLSGGRASSVL